MPADHDELAAILEEGVDLQELVVPAQIRRADGELEVVCTRMRLGAPGEDGRPRPRPVAGSEQPISERKWRTPYEISPSVTREG